jgi:hypothetical protein
MLAAGLGSLAALLGAPAASAAEEWLWPVRGAVITPYSNDNARPYAGGMHRGIDIAARVGASVTAARSGTVTFAGALGSSGITVALATADGLHVTSYLHLRSVAVKRGERVGAGQKIGEAGTSGRRSAAEPHLHFGVRRAGRAHAYVDPLSLLPPTPGERSAPPAPVVAPVPARPRLQAAPVPSRVIVQPGAAPLKPVPAGVLRRDRAQLRSRHRNGTPSPVPALTPEPPPFPALGWGPPVSVAGLLLLGAVLGRRLQSGARGQHRAQPSPSAATVGVSSVETVSQVG